MNPGIDYSSQFNIPLELWTPIIAYLPVKSAVRFRSVSKLWKSIIEDPKFNYIHLERCLNNNIQNRYLIVCKETIGEKLTLVLRHSDTSGNNPIVEFPGGGNTGKTWKIYNEVDGLILLLEKAYKCQDVNILLWNPSIKKAVYLPPPPNIPFSGICHRLCLLFDVVNDDYKVVLITEDMSAKRYPSAEVFSLKTHSWRRVDGNISAPAGNWVTPADDVCIGGSVYWIRLNSEENVRRVMSFDVTTDVFLSIPFPTDGYFPPDYPGCGKMKTELIVLPDSILGILVNLWYSPSTIWEMERSSSTSSPFNDQYCPRWQCWSKRYQKNVGLKSFPTYITVQKHFILMPMGDDLVTAKPFITLSVCDLGTGELKYLPGKNKDRPIYIAPYVDSLLLLTECRRLTSCSTTVIESQ